MRAWLAALARLVLGIGPASAEVADLAPFGMLRVRVLVYDPVPVTKASDGRLSGSIDLAGS
jgi:hypothetical protein